MSGLGAATGSGITDIFAHEFMRNALLAGTAVALAAGLAGYFVVLRGQVFTGDALSHVAFTGALGALAVGLGARLGLYAATALVAAGMALLGRRGRPDDVVVGSLFAWVLGLGVLFLGIYTTSHSAANGRAGVNVLFGSIFGVGTADAVTVAAVGAATCAVLVFIARPLLFATVDEAVAVARGVRVRAVGLVFLLALGVVVAQATQAVGALLLLGLLAAPAGAAQRLTARPFRAMWLSAVFAVGSMWAGLVASYLVPKLPPSFAVITAAAGIYLASIAAGRAVRQSGQSPSRSIRWSLTS